MFFPFNKGFSSLNSFLIARETALALSVFQCFIIQVTEDQKLLREKVMHLSGDAGIERMESALSETRSRSSRVKDSGSPMGFPMTQYLTPSPTPLSTVASPSERNISNKSNKTSRVVRSLFKESDTSPIESSFSSPITSSNTQLSTTSEKFVAPNEVLVNEFLHEHHRSFADGFDVSDHIQNSVEVRGFCLRPLMLYYPVYDFFLI